MIDLTKYARTIELKHFSPVNESYVQEKGVDLTPTQSDFDIILQNKPGSGSPNEAAFKATWDSIVGIVVKNVNDKKYSGFFEFKAINATIDWSVDQTTGKVTLTERKAGTETPSESSHDNEKFNEFARKIIDASAGAGTDEEQINQVFYAIQNQEEFDQFLEYFKSLEIAYSNSPAAGYTIGEPTYTMNQLKKDIGSGRGREDITVKAWLQEELNSKELQTVDAILQGKGITSDFSKES